MRPPKPNQRLSAYARPTGVNAAKGRVNLGRNDIVRGVVQIVKKHGGENNLHYHTTSASFWMVLMGQVRFYGPRRRGDRRVRPERKCTISAMRYARYWFENVGDDDLELLQVSAFAEGAKESGRTDAAPQRFDTQPDGTIRGPGEGVRGAVEQNMEVKKVGALEKNF